MVCVCVCGGGCIQRGGISTEPIGYFSGTLILVDR